MVSRAALVVGLGVWAGTVGACAGVASGPDAPVDAGQPWPVTDAGLADSGVDAATAEADAATSNDAGTDASVTTDSDASVDDAGADAGTLVYIVTGQDMRHLVSFDGLTWHHDEYVPANGLDNAFTGVAIGNHCIVISGDPGVYRSVDGITYTKVVSPVAGLSFHSSQALFANGQFFIVNGAWSFRSPDGLTWESKKATEGSSGHWHALVFGAGRLLALGDGVRKVSENGLDWHDITPFEPGQFQAVAYGNGQFLAVGKVSTTVDGGPETAGGWVATSADGLSWVAKPVVPTVYNTGLATVAFGDGLFFTKRAGDVLQSADGETWSVFTKPAPAGDLRYARGRLASAGWRTEASVYLPDAGRFVSGYSGTHPNRFDDAGIEPWFTGFGVGEL